MTTEIEEEVVALTPEEETAELAAGFIGGEVVPPAEPEPETVTLTKDEYQRIVDGIGRIDTLEQTFGGKIDTAFGKIGGVERVIDQLRSSAPAGKKIELTEEIVADLAAEFPEMAGLQFKTLQKLVDVINASAPAPAPAAADAAGAPQPSAPAPAVDEAAMRHRIRREMTEETLDEYEPKWRDVIGLPDAKGVIPDTEFRKWLATQPAEYSDRVKSTYSADVLKGAMEKFKEAKSKARGRREVLDAGAMPRGSGSQAATATPTEDDEFRNGFDGK